MSIILDALRKSETARRRSEAPDLFMAMPTAVASAPARPAWPLMAVGAIGVVSLIAALWLFLYRPQPTPADSARPADEAHADAPASAPRVDVEDALTLGEDAGPSTMSPGPTSVSAKPAPTRTAAPLTPPTAPSRQDSTATPTVDAAQTAPLREAPTRPTPIQMQMPAAMPTPSAPPALPPAAGSNDAATALADLDPGTRRLLPPLKMSMHLWNETPSQRFVILDGQRLKEGDVIGDIVIERITRTGTVLAWRGSRIRIELR